MKKPRIIQAATLLFCAMLAGGGHAGEKEELEALRSTTQNLIQLLVKEGVLTKEKADALLREAAKPAAPAAPAQAGAPAENKVIRVPYVPETVRNEIRDQVKEEVLAQARAERWGDAGALPEWLGRIQWEGDLRLRYQRERFPTENAPAFNFNTVNSSRSLTNALQNTTQDRERLRLRGRIGMNAKVADDWSVGLRLVTGNTTDPVSTNQTLGNYNNKYSLVLDRAFVKYEPADWLAMTGGKIPNPWFGTDLVWNENLNFEGIAATLRPKFSETLRGFLTAGAFALQEVELSARDKWLVGVQTGLDLHLERSRYKAGIGLYDYRNTTGIFNPVCLPAPCVGPFDYRAPPFVQKGNTLFDISGDGRPLFALAPDFRELNLTAQAVWEYFDPVHVILTGDYVKNIGYDRQQIFVRTGGLVDQEARTKGYHVRLAIGNPDVNRRHYWQIFGAYKYLERDAVVDAFTDSDFHLGGTNNKGFILGAQYGLDRNTALGLRWLSSSQIDGVPLSMDILQLDLNLRF
jgi:hypothetical protein